MVDCILLAAGYSRRLGQPKQLLDFDGAPLVRRVAETMLRLSFRSVSVIVGHEVSKMKIALEGLKLHVVENSESSEGLASSIRAGVQSLLDNERSIEGVLFVLVDQLNVDEDHFRKMIEVYEGCSDSHISIIASSYNGTSGVPAIFDKVWIQELLSLSGGKGAQKIILSHPDQVALIETKKDFIDIDRPQDIELLSKETHAKL